MTSLDLQGELRRAQEIEHAGRHGEALAVLENVSDADDPFVPWIWYFAAVMADRIGDTGRLLTFSGRFIDSPLTTDPDYRTAQVDMLVKRIIHLKRSKRRVADDVTRLMRLEPSRNELDPIYATQFAHVLPRCPSIAPDKTIKLSWQPCAQPLEKRRLGAAHYAIDKRPHPVGAPRLHIAREALYVSARTDGGLWKRGYWCRGLGTGPSVEQTLDQLRTRGIPPLRLPGRGLILSDWFSPDNYCHWTMDWVPRALLAAEFGGGFDWVFMRGTRKRFQLEWLKLLGIDPFRVIYEDGLACYKMDEFIYCDSGNIDVTHPAYGGHPEIVKRLRAAAGIDRAAPGRRRIFISRADGGGRGIINEAEVLALVARHGFDVVRLSDLSLTEQIALFAAAEAVVGVHGAGLTNLLYMPEGSLVVELLHHLYGTNSYVMPAVRSGLRYAYLACPGYKGERVSPDGKPPANPMDFITSPIWVDIAQLETALELLPSG